MTKKKALAQIKKDLFFLSPDVDFTSVCIEHFALTKRNEETGLNVYTGEDKIVVTMTTQRKGF